MAEAKYGLNFNSRLFAEQLLFMDDIEDFSIDFHGPGISRAVILAFFAVEVGSFSLA